MSDSDRKSQLRMFEEYNPLENRLGKEFFDLLPQTPGIYKMYSVNEQLLYVGKAKNLRHRLFTYRRVNSKNGSRKVLRLVRMVHKIDLEHYETEERALLRENELLRLEKPPFNVAKTQPETYYYIGLARQSSNLLIRLTMKPETGDKEWFYGAFKGHTLVRGALGAFIRYMLIIYHDLGTPFEFPPVLTRKLVPWYYRFEWPADMVQAEKAREFGMFDAFLSGRSEALLEQWLGEVQQRDLLSGAMGRLLLEDAEVLKRFYQRCPQRNYEMCQSYQPGENTIRQHELDDFLIRKAFDQPDTG